MKITRKQLKRIIKEAVQSITQTPSGAYTGDQSTGSISDLLQSVEAEIQATTASLNSLDSTDPEKTQERKSLNIKLSDLRRREQELANKS